MNLDTALDAFVIASRAYDDLAAQSKAHPFDADLRARCEMACTAQERARSTLFAAWDAAQADPVPALIEQLEAKPRPLRIVPQPAATNEASS